MNQHIAFVNSAAPGHINPTLPLVEELTRRGHRVSYATGSEAVPAVRAAGAEAVHLPLRELSGPPPDGQITTARFALLLSWLVSDAEAGLPVLLDRFGGDRPDVVCYDRMALAGPVLAETLALPQAALLPNFASNEHFNLRQEFLSPSAFDWHHPELGAAFGRLRELARRYGVDSEILSVSETVAPVNLVFLPRSFQIAGETFDQRFRFLGPAVGRRADQGWQPARSDVPVVFVSLGTLFTNQAEFYRRCLEAFGESGDQPCWQVAMSVGSHVDPAELGTVPSNVDVRPSFPQPAVLRHAAVFVTHAGMNSTMESLYYGVPIVAVPQMHEQAANAARAEELGLGRRLVREEVTAGLVRTAVDEVAADGQIRDRVREMRHEIHRCGGPAEGADVLEAQVR